MRPLATVEVQQLDGLSIARLRGEIDTSNVDEIREALSAADAGRSEALIVDLSAVLYLNSATVKVLYDLAEQRQQRHQQMCLVMAETAPMRKLMQLLRFDLVVPLHATLEDAAAQIRTGGATGGT